MCLQRMLRSVFDTEKNGDKESNITVKGKDRTDKIHGHEKGERTPMRVFPSGPPLNKLC